MLLGVSVSLAFVTHSSSMVEICDNGIDDDNDGLIDLNDSECACEIAEPVSLIPNPSFEEKSCCPVDRSSLNCAETWIQASEATTDYLHKCGWFGWPDLPVPLPLPDGEACIGFRDGRFGREPNPNWKEYTGACLTSPLVAGNTYKFQFWLGFTQFESSPPLNVVFYGSTDCKNLPFGSGDEAYGCPTNGPGWKELDRIYASGSNRWLLQEFTVTPEEDIYAIAIGPDCIQQNYLENPYYFLDNLVLADIREFDFVISTLQHPCDDFFRLSIPKSNAFTYQWYRDGIALVGETRTDLLTQVEGSYQVLVREVSTGSCKLTKPYIYDVPVLRTSIKRHVCEGETIEFNRRTVSHSGTYIDTLSSQHGCDSIVEVVVSMVSDTIKQVNAKIFSGETYQIGSQTFDEPTSKNVTLQSSLGCDSTVFLNLSYYEVFIPNAVTPNGDGINDHFSIHGGSELLRIETLQIFNRWGGKIFDGTQLPSNANIPIDLERQYSDDVFIYVTTLLMDDQKTHKLKGSFTLLNL